MIIYYQAPHSYIHWIEYCYYTEVSVAILKTSLKLPEFVILTSDLLEMKEKKVLYLKTRISCH